MAHSDKVRQVKESIREGNSKAVQLAYLTFAVEVLIDTFDMISIDLEHSYKENGLMVHKNKQLVNKYRKAVKDLVHYQHRYLGADKVAEDFGDLADYMYDLIMNAMFIKPDDRIKLLSVAKLLHKGSAQPS